MYKYQEGTNLKRAKWCFPLASGGDDLFVDQNQFFHELDPHDFILLATVSDGDVHLDSNKYFSVQFFKMVISQELLPGRILCGP